VLLHGAFGFVLMINGYFAFLKVGIIRLISYGEICIQILQEDVLCICVVLLVLHWFMDLVARAMDIEYVSRRVSLVDLSFF